MGATLSFAAKLPLEVFVRMYFALTGAPKTDFEGLSPAHP